MVEQETEIFEGRRPADQQKQSFTDSSLKNERKSKAQRNLEREEAKSSEASSSILTQKSSLLVPSRDVKQDKLASFKDYLAQQKLREVPSQDSTANIQIFESKHKP